MAVVEENNNDDDDQSTSLPPRKKRRIEKVCYICIINNHKLYIYCMYLQKENEQQQQQQQQQRNLTEAIEESPIKEGEGEGDYADNLFGGNCMFYVFECASPPPTRIS